MSNNLVSLFFVGILSITLVVLMLFLTTSRQLDDFLQLTKDDIAGIEVKNFMLFHIKKNTTDILIIGKSAQKFDGKEIFGYVKISRILEDKTKEEVASEEIYRKGSIFIFPAGVDYAKNNVKFFSETGVLDTKKDIFEGKGAFTFVENNNTLSGSDITYNSRTKQVAGNKIQAKIATK